MNLGHRYGKNIRDDRDAENALTVEYELLEADGDTATITVTASTVDEGAAIAQDAAEHALGGDWAVNEWRAA